MAAEQVLHDERFSISNPIGSNREGINPTKMKAITRLYRKSFKITSLKKCVSLYYTIFRTSIQTESIVLIVARHAEYTTIRVLVTLRIFFLFIIIIFFIDTKMFLQMLIYFDIETFNLTQVHPMIFDILMI